MQHGVTPAPWVTATVHFVDMSSGETIDVVAKNDNANGHFVATATLPRAGFWSWQVTLEDLDERTRPGHARGQHRQRQLPALD